MESVEHFVSVTSGRGAGSSSGSGSGWGDGSGWGAGSGWGHGSGSGHGSGWGSSSGSGHGSGWGDGSGWGSGHGSGWGDGVSSINGNKVYQIDGMETIITRVVGDVAKGFILGDDLRLTPCYVCKSGDTFAHGKTLREAQSALVEKPCEEMSEDDRISEFLKRFPEPEKKYPNKDFFEWHHNLTGSCEMGRKAFIKNNGLDINGTSTVAEFIALTENAYGGSVIRALKKRLEDAIALAKSNTE